MSEITPDERTRLDVVTRLDTSLYVEAGAGSGKTSALVSRLTSMLSEGKATPSQVAAITFTRAAAFEMRSRVRAHLEKNIDSASDAEKNRLQEIIDSLDSAAIQTINSFALSLLKERPLAVGLPPVLSPMDEIQAGIDFDERWTQWLGSRLDGDAPLVTALGLAQRMGLDRPLENLRSLVNKLADRYHLLKPGMFEFHEERPAGLAISRIVDTLDEIRRDLAIAPDVEDKLYVFTVEKSVPELERLLAQYDEVSHVPDVELVDLPPIAPGGNSKGAKSKWRKAPGGLEAHERLNETLRGLQDEIDEIVALMRAETLSVLLSAATDFTLEHAAMRKRTGAVTFHDQLVLARDLLRDDPDARRLFNDRYRVMLVDEFQDTDPLQVELLRLLAGIDESGVTPANLFLVGDPKQSIYRFRGADPAVARSLTDQVSAFGEKLSLSENHRSQLPVLSWVNYIFSNWMGEQESNGQAPYKDLAWPGESESEQEIDSSSSVQWFGGEIPDSANASRALEFREISWIAQAAGRGAFEVRGFDKERRPSTYGDLAVLIKTRAGMEDLEDELITAGVPYVFEGQSPLFNSQDVRDLRSCLTAIDDPSDQVATLAALRTPAFSCSDPDLLNWKLSGGSFFYLDDAPEGSTGPVVDASAELNRYHRLSREIPVVKLVETFIRDRQLREKAVLSRTGPERTRRLNMVVELAASVSGDQPVTLREFTAWMERQASENARIPETVSESADSNAVRIMTMHASKGLEFPIVVLASARASVSGRDSAQTLVWRDENGIENLDIQLGSEKLKLRTNGFDVGKEREKIFSDLEDVRLLYVAATRARDHLFVSRYRGVKERKGVPLVARIDELMSECPDELWRQLEIAPSPRVAVKPLTTKPDTANQRESWKTDRTDLIERSSRRGYVTPTSLKSAKTKRQPLPKTESDSFDGEPGRFGRGAAERGRAVHGLLQHIPLTGWTDEDIDRLAEQMADSHGIPELKADVVDLASRALITEALKAAVEAAKRGKAWREVSIAAPVDGADGALEGQIDLLFEDENGDLVVVDYKTDHVPGGNVKEAAEPYLLQMGAYAWAVENLTGKHVTRATLVFARLADTGASAEYSIPDLGLQKNEAALLAHRSLTGTASDG